ncbi:MAG: tetratricopeptide repeat protein, partial [Actinobacteria bacterium]|nr:tetratricopeptide repeat protein [Actinomycetota bacterium]
MRLPDTLQTLIAARIDRLPASARVVLRRAAVIGRTFWAGAIERLSPEVSELGDALEDLLLRDFVQREPRSTIRGEDAYRFKHVLIRDVAYSGLPKAARADLHERFAGWLAERAGEELLEIRAYHLDQAAALVGELEGAVPPAQAREAAEALDAVGKRALAREANRSARRLLLRAHELDPTLQRRYEAARAAWRLKDLPALAVEMELVREGARAVGNQGLEGRALIALAEVAIERDADVERARALAEQALSAIGDDDEARYDALDVLGTVGWWEGDLTRVERQAEEKVELARRLGRKDLESGALTELAGVYRSRLDEERAEPLLARALELADESGSIVARAWIARLEAERHARREELVEAEEAFTLARDLFAEAGAATDTARMLNWLGFVRWRRGDLLGAEKLMREAIRTLKPLEDRGTLVESQRTLAQVLLEQGKLEEAERCALESRETVGSRDQGSRATTRVALALVRAAQGRDEEAETLLREALAILEGTDFRFSERLPLETLAAFLRERGREDEAEPYERRLAAVSPIPSAAPMA